MIFTRKYNSLLPRNEWIIFLNINRIIGKTRNPLFVSFGVVKHLKDQYDGVPTVKGVPIARADGWRMGFTKSFLI